MIIKYIVIIGLSALLGSILADTSSLKADTLASVQPTFDSTSKFSSTVAGSLSLAVPGAGQFYTRQYFKGSTVVAPEMLTIGISIYQYNSFKTLQSDKKPYLLKADTSIGVARLKYLNDAELVEYDSRLSKYRMQNALACAGGIYVYGFLDAIGKAKGISNADERSPLRAGLLSAIPGLGLGQWYNGEVSKAGMIFMGQMSLGVVSANYHRLMTKAERQKLAIENLRKPDSVSYAGLVSAGYATKWENERQSAFKYRNTYLWYSIFYYLYGIFDAVVDAHLHDYPEKMKLYPDLVPSDGGGAELRLNLEY